MTKLCTRCKKDLDAKAFARCSARKDGLQGWCRNCVNSQEIKYRETRKSYRRAYNQARYQTENGRRKHLNAYFKHEYGFSLEGYERLLEIQDGKCAICKQSPDRHRLYVDHCHSTGQVRGLLCFHCNTALGHFNDSPELLEAALRYLYDKK